ncbi:MAG: sulfite exporter TauE/SafE family protein [Chloroflexi bacterium]|nr:sulfite exporter TauE/SafE family protein [Chloroflexota bacterium]
MLKQQGVILFLVTGAAGGLVAGFMGVGGGIVVVPMLVALIGLKVHQASGTSLGIIAIVAPAAALPYLLRGDWDWPLLGWLVIGTTVGVLVGTRAMRKFSPRVLQALFALLMVAVGLRLAILGG